MIQKVIDLAKLKIDLMAAIGVVSISGSVIVYLLTSIFSVDTRAAILEQVQSANTTITAETNKRVDKLEDYVISEAKEKNVNEKIIIERLSRIEGILQERYRR